MMKDKEPRHRQILVPELCQVHPVPASLWRQGICLPTILHRIYNLLVMEELLTNIRSATGISSRSSTNAKPFWPMLDYGWSFEEKIKNLDCSHLERDAIDIRNASIIEKARLRHEHASKNRFLPTIEMWNPADADNLSEVGSYVSNRSGGFEIGTWNPEPSSGISGDIATDEWDVDVRTAPPVPFFEHVEKTYGLPQVKKPTVTKKRDFRSLDNGDGFGVESNWGCDTANSMPGISLVSGFSDNVMEAIEKDLISLNLDDSGLLRGTSDIGEGFW